MAQLSIKQQNITNLLLYAEQILRITERFTTDLAKDAFAHFHESEIAHLDGVSTNSAEDVWIRVDRLAENPPPSPPRQYAEWVSPAVGGALKRPALVRQRMERLAIEDVSDLVEACLIDSKDAIRPLDVTERQPDEMDVLLRLAKLPEFAAGFEQWVDGPWAEWLQVEAPRRNSIAFYNKLFEAQQRMVAMGDDATIECLLGVGIARWLIPNARIDLPLIEAAVELDLDPQDGAILVRPRPMPPRLSLRAFEDLGIVSGGTLVRDASERLQRSYDDPDVGFSPFDTVCFDPVLRMCHARLSSSSIYLADGEHGSEDRLLIPADEKLRISDTWVLFLRQRSTDFRCDDIRKLVKKVETTAGDEKLPAAAVQLTSKVANKAIDDDFGDLTDTTRRLPEAGHYSSYDSSPTSSSEGMTGQRAKTDDRTFLFPLAFNEEQMEIVRRLDDPEINAVVVQGPPGTGKTHTIANIICHYMATGRRILVSARTAEALSAIQHKLPPEIADLAISVIHSDREGAKQLETAIDILASQIKQIDGRAYSDLRHKLEGQIAETHRDLSVVDQRIRAYADLNLASVDYRGESRMPMDLVRMIEHERPTYGWFEDALSPDAEHEPGFSAEHIDRARSIRRTLGCDIVYPSEALPPTGSLPDLARVLAAHAALMRQREMKARVVNGDLAYVSYGPKATPTDARALRTSLEDLAGWFADIPSGDSWILDLYRMVADQRPKDPVVTGKLKSLTEEWGSLYNSGSGFLLQGLTVAGIAPVDAAFDAAVDSLAQGKKPFGVLSFGKSALKSQIEAVVIEGRSPAGAADWTSVRDYRKWQKSAFVFLGRWAPVAELAAFPCLPRDWDEGSRQLMRLGKLVEPVTRYHACAAQQIVLLAALFPHGIDGQRVVLHGDTAVVLEAFRANEEREGHADVQAVTSAIEAVAGSYRLPLHDGIRSVREALGDEAVPVQELAEGWRSLIEEAERLGKLAADRRLLEEVAAKVAASGAPMWAQQLLETAVDDEDHLTPAAWSETWAWARADGHVRRLTARSGLAKLAEQRAALEERQQTLLRELVKVRTYLGLKRGITERIASSLTKFAMTVRKLGAGTGKAAERHRRAIRESVLEAADAVPCWILPEWRVAEQLPSELATFDLVIIDEASQSDITSLPAVMRGKKLLIVGDDRQVSPSAVGMEERTVVQLRQTFLRGMPLENYLEPTTSLYDLASMMFPGSTILLREHYRCVEPIIRFSSRFYPKALVPLRLPTTAERLDPPLIDIYVPHGRKVREVNEAEVGVTVQEIAKLVDDPAFAKRSLGVISLIGDKQAKRIYERLTAEIGTEAMARHQIMCGNASTFQGQERDIIFLSMVACPETARAQTARMMEQRFNVAMSRARDRMYLIRSVAASMLSEKDLKAAVIEHFRNPMGSDAVARPTDIFELCDSDFERSVGRRLLERGYRVTPQVAVGGFRIDFVVEGEDNRRLAIELDGDRYHGPDRWAEDLHRQRALERIGWVFWRCWGSHWLADQADCFDDLLATLEQQGIQPIGGEYSSRVFSEHRVVGIAAEEGLPTSDVQSSDVPVLVVDNTAAIDAPVVAPGPSPRQAELIVVEAGDQVIVRYADDNRVRIFRLSVDVDDPASGVVHIAKPIGMALMGNGLEEEVELVVDGRTRTVIIEKVMKAA